MGHFSVIGDSPESTDTAQSYCAAGLTDPNQYINFCNRKRHFILNKAFRKNHKAILMQLVPQGLILLHISLEQQSG